MTKQKAETYLATLNASCDWTTLQLDDALLHDQGGEEEADTKLSGHGGLVVHPPKINNRL